MNDELTLIEDSEAENAYSDQIETISDVLTDTSEIMSDTQTVVAAQEAGLLSSVALTMYAGRVEKYLTRNFGSKENRSLALTIRTSGMESNNPADLQAGLEGVLEVLKETGKVLWDMIKKAFANFVNFFAGMYNKWQTRTGAIEKKLNELVKGQALYGTIKVKGSELNAIYNKYSLAAIAANVSNNDPREPLDLLSSVLDMANEIKLPDVDLEKNFFSRIVSDIVKAFTVTPSENKPEKLEQSIIKELAKSKDSIISADVKLFENPEEMRIISMDGNKLTIVGFNGFGTMITKNFTTDIKTYQNLPVFQEDKEYEIDGKVFKKMADDLLASVKNLNGAFRKEAKKRIDNLKAISDSTLTKMSSMSRVLDNSVGGDEEFNKKKWQKANQELKDIWGIYPNIVNYSTKNLFNTINNTYNIVAKLTGVSTASETTEEKK